MSAPVISDQNDKSMLEWKTTTLKNTTEGYRRGVRPLNAQGNFFFLGPNSKQFKTAQYLIRIKNLAAAFPT